MPAPRGWKVVAGGKSPLFTCYLCDFETHTRSSACPKCGRFDTLIRGDGESSGDDDAKRAKQAARIALRPHRFISTGAPAWDAVLGGGFVKPSSLLIYGPSGVGKSSRVLELALHAARLVRGRVLYGSAEMPAAQLRFYAERLGASSSDLERLWVQDSKDAIDLLLNIEQVEPTIVVWDSIQRMTWEGESGELELRKVVRAAIDATKERPHVSILLSQVGKDGSYLGPNGIGHDVDAIVRLSRQERDLIIETTTKNRFAPTPARQVERLGAEHANHVPPEPTIEGG